VHSSNAVDLSRRASPQAPNGYAPAEVDCPSTRPSIRSADGLSTAETEWLKKRRPNTVDPMRELLVRANIDGFDAGKYIDDHRNNVSALPNIAISWSGGGYRALLNGAGAFAAFDNRTPNATSKGHLGGLLQAATYTSALSGGGWMLGSIFANNFTSVQSIQDKKDVWQFQNNLFKGPPTGGIQVLSTADYFNNLASSVKSKSEAQGEFNTSITDLYGRGLSFQLINAADGGPAYTYSSIQDDTGFSQGNTPMPILLADGRAPGEKIISLNATNYEFNPFEMGTFDPTTYGFVPTKYIGSNFTNGQIDQSQRCVRGFDNLGFVMGTSSSLFNSILLNLGGLGLPGFINDLVTGFLDRLGRDNNDIADYTPNPFRGFNPATNRNANASRLTLVDGGLDGQNIPFNPLIQPVRQVDVIFAVDSSADTVESIDPSKNWPNGTSLVATYRRAGTPIMNRTSFPFIPGQDTFVALGLNNRPTFFGCNSTNVTEGDNIPPLIVYLPNAPYAFFSNFSTFEKLEYSLDERNAVIQNGYEVVTQANATRENAANWPTCVACAVIARSLERNGQALPQACQQCFTQYCWNGTTVEQSARYNPTSLISTAVNIKSGVGRFVPNVFGLAVAALGSGYLMI